MNQSLLNGEQTTLIALTDRGLQYGDGLFETIALSAGQLTLWSYHIERLNAGCRRLAIPVPDESLLLKEAELLTKGVKQGVVKIIITRGSGGRGYRPPVSAEPNRIVTLHSWPDYPAAWFKTGVVLRLCQTRLGSNPSLAGIKHLNRLEQVLARREWSDPEIAEGLMLDGNGQVIEATQSNLFLLYDGQLVTPDLSCCGVAGTVRRLVMEVAQEQAIPLEISAVTLQQVRQADALFLTNAITGILPVKQFEKVRYDVTSIPTLLIEEVNKHLHR
ncbi:MAG: aminodeoxychorismate lyase [Candidatus Polarisedimenticolaceae bacterium]|nr:aminodeoxychorismate lyase [Candidatus Polarisedimenticolaceae bacterium]